MQPELSRPLALTAVPAAGREERIEASPAECRSLARRFAIPAIDSLTAMLRLVPEAGGSVRARGLLEAAVVQTCVVTLDPVAQRVEATLDLRFVRQGEALSDDPEGPDEIEAEGGMMDLGEAVAEQLALALDPYPRAPGASLPDVFPDAPPEAEEPPSRPNPFAVLRDRGRGS